MAYAGKAPNKSGIWSGFADFGMHGIAAYGLATGLGIDYGREAIAIAKIGDLPLDPLAKAPLSVAVIAEQAPDISSPLLI